MIEESLVDQLKSAYRKFKSYTYYDNYGAINRAKLANFEFNFYSSDDFFKDSDEFFKDLASKLKNENERKTLFEDQYNKIDVLCYPKSMESSNKNSENMPLGNIPEDSDKLEKLNYFIDLDVTSHILGTLWILRCGWVLDHRLHTNCHGNRLNKQVLSKIVEAEKDGRHYAEKTPFLFEPYFKKYQTWRDEGLDSVQKLLDKKENALMLTLDFKEYYYTSTINFDKLKNDIKEAKCKLLDNCDEIRDFKKTDENSEDIKEIKGNTNESNGKDEEFNSKLDEDLTDFIKSIFERYTENFKRPYYEKVKSNSEERLPLIPIGFLPSLIIANWNLQAFDQHVLDRLNPAYYGRYVDDLLIVLKSHPEMESFSKEKLDITPCDLIEKYFFTTDPLSCNIKINNLKPKNTILNHKTNILNFFFDTNNNEEGYGVNNLLEKEFRYKKCESAIPNKFESNYENLRIPKRNKLKIFRFNHENSRALIENFKKEIYRNSSEFRLMHTVEKSYADIEKNIFSIHYADSINKISDIKSIKLNKFELSKTLSWLIRTSIYETDKSSSKENIKNIKHAFSGIKKIEFMILWEKFIEFLFIEKEYKTLEKEIEKILIKISKLTYKENANTTYYYKGNSEELIKKTLTDFLYFTFTRVISLKSSDKNIDSIKKRFEKLLKEEDGNVKEKYIDIPFKFVLSYLYKNSLMIDPLFLIGTIKPTEFDFKTYNLIKPNFQILNENKLEVYPYYPRYVQFHETTIHCINKVIFNSNTDLDINEYLNSSKKYYDLINGFKNETNSENEKFELKNNLFYKNICGSKDCNCLFINNNKRHVNIINTGLKKKSNVKIGLINTRLNSDLLEKALKGDPNRTSKRLDKIADIINEAIHKKVELLVMPEMYVPYEWVPGLLDISRTHNMAMVFGVEPLIHDNYVGNYIAIALPSETEDDYKNCTLLMRLKKHYSPGELREYRKHNLKAKDNTSTKYVLCIWNNIYFAPYYCYEIADIGDRSLFKSCCDIVIVSEYNRDTAYFTAIAESLSRDLFCYCIKVNSSEFGGTCIIQPSKRENKYLINLKGGDKDYVVTHTLNIEKLRNHQILNYEAEIKDTELKPKPPGFDINIVRKRMNLKPRGNK